MKIASSYEALSRMLDYPQEKRALQDDYAIVREGVGDLADDCSLPAFRDFIAASELTTLQEEYVATFDFNPATSLYLGHHLFGDNQKKSGYMIGLKQEFSRYGYCPVGNELPDHLSVVLGFLAFLSEGEKSDERRSLIAKLVLPGVERLNAAFASKQDSPWRPILEAVQLLCTADCKEVPSC